MGYKKQYGGKTDILLHLKVIVKINRRLNLKSQMIKKCQKHDELNFFTERKDMHVSELGSTTYSISNFKKAELFFI